MRIIFFILIFSLVTTGCAAQPTDEILADSAFSGRALLDVNGNHEIDDEDTPIENASFYVEINGVKAFGDTTDKTGNAFILIPGGVEYPVRVSMEAPKDSTLKLITPAPVTVSGSTGDIQFLFSSK